MKEIRPSQSYIDESRAKALVEKWSPVLDYNSTKVNPIEDDHTRLNTAILLENQEQWCLKENSSYGANSLGTDSNIGAQGGQFPGSSDHYAANDARLPKILIPMIRRTFPELITNEIVGVQPMSGPVGLAFALRYKYEKEALGNGVDGQPSGTGATQTANVEATDGSEAGYQLLDTRFTGTSSTSLTGAGVTEFSWVDDDKGAAKLLANYELTSNIPQMVVSFEKTAVEAGTRRLAARWSVELEQDLKNMNGIDIDTELTNAMSYELQAEIDREMLMRMLQVCLTQGQTAGYSFWKNRDLYQKLIVEANRIAVRNRRGAANFVVATPRVCAILEMLPEFQWVPVQGDVNTQPVGIAKVGSLGGRFNVYRDTRTEVQNGEVYSGANAREYSNNSATGTSIEYALLGYKGPEFYDTGIIYCPYIPVMVQRTIGPNDFAPRVGLLTRYGVVDNIFGANLYYHVILVQGLGTAFTPGSTAVYF